jgi:cell division septal protein FtsQ
MLPVEERKTWIKSRRNQRKTARGARLRRQVFRLFLVITVLSIGYLGFAYLPWSVNDSNSEIIVKGNHFTSKEQIRAALVDTLYTPVYAVDPKKQERKVEALETINNAFVRRYAFPRPHVVVEVLEEQPWASLGSDPEQPTHSVISETGRIIPLKKFPHVMSPALKIYAGANLKMTAVDVKQWATWVTFIEKQTEQQVVSVDMRKPFDVTAHTPQLSLKIGIPDAALTHRLGRLTSILPTLAQYKDTLEYVDLSLDNNIPLKISKKLDGKAAAEAKSAAAEKAKMLINQQPIIPTTQVSNTTNTL